MRLQTCGCKSHVKGCRNHMASGALYQRLNLRVAKSDVKAGFKSDVEISKGLNQVKHEG